MVDNMKKLILFFLVFILSENNVYAEYVRKIKEPDFFIPYSDRMHKPEILPTVKKQDKSINKTVKNNQKSKTSFNKKPEYKSIYDNYLKEVNNYLLTKKFERSDILEADLSVMSDGNIFEVKDDSSTSITTQEQYDFYMLAKKILKN